MELIAYAVVGSLKARATSNAVQIAACVAHTGLSAVTLYETAQSAKTSVTDSQAAFQKVRNEAKIRRQNRKIRNSQDGSQGKVYIPTP
jgi:hypothetical protein